MNIWVIGRNYPDEKNNRQGSFELEQAKMLAKRGHHVVYIYCRLHSPMTMERNGKVFFQDGDVSVRGVTRIFFPHFAGSRLPSFYFPGVRNKIWSNLLGEIDKEFGTPDVIHIHYPTVVLASSVFSVYHDRGTKVVVTEHWTKVLNKRLDAYEISQMKHYLSYVNAYMCVGPKLRKAIQELTGSKRKIIIMPNVVNECFHPAKKSSSEFVFGVVGRLAPEKQVGQIIEAFAKLCKNRNNIVLMIVGDGKERKILEQRVKAFHIEDRVTFTGSLSRKDTSEVVNKLNCLVMFSRCETFGVPAIEAWASGIPVITSAGFHIMSKWDERLGITVNCQKPQELFDAMNHMVDHVVEYDNAYIYQYAQDHFSEDTIYQKLMNVYSNV